MTIGVRTLPIHASGVEGITNGLDHVTIVNRTIMIRVTRRQNLIGLTVLAKFDGVTVTLDVSAVVLKLIHDHAVVPIRFHCWCVSSHNMFPSVSVVVPLTVEMIMPDLWKYYKTFFTSLESFFRK
jgi:hypothetical protein